MIEFELQGNQYRAGKLDAFAQLHVSRRIAPLIPALIPVFVRVAKGGLTKDLAGLAEIIKPFADGLAAMDDESAEFVITTCLSVVKRQATGNNWAPVWSKSGKCSMFDDIDLGAMIPLVVRVIQDSLGPFIQGMLTSQTPALVEVAAA